MNKRTFFFAFLFLMTASVEVFAQVKSPAEFLGYELGEHFTPHHKVLAYVHHVADNSSKAVIETYGYTNEGKELVYLIISSEQNVQDIEEIRTNNLKLTGLVPGSPTGLKKAIVWLSYNVHGNETSSSEAAMNTLWELVRNGNTNAAGWLQNVVVIMDPMVNPDGRDRYVNWFNTTVGKQMNAHADAREHREPWPGGRVNHYYFDLNRDWAWQTQVETKNRIEVYNQWMPHVHVDFHEQFFNSPYYFAPGAEPLHKAITDWQRNFQAEIGENHARYFDENNWFYFTKEVFDLFYPSYGDTWPTFNGAIGMTYEQAGHSFAGLGIIKAEGDTLTLLDRLTHHSTTGLSTIEIAAKRKDEIIKQFEKYFVDSVQNPAGDYKTYVVSQNNNPDKLQMLFDYLNRQQIQVTRFRKNRAVTAAGFDFSIGKEGQVQVQTGDYIISSYQPKSALIRALFEPNPELSDSLTYDITAWQMHYAYGLSGAALKTRVDGEPFEFAKPAASLPSIEKPYAYLAQWKSLQDARFLSALLKRGIAVRAAELPFSMNGKNYDSGTLIITRGNNQSLGASFDEIIREEAEKYARVIDGTATGMVSSGKDFGSGSVSLLKAPNVLLVVGEGTSANTVGHIWHFFDNELEYPVTLVNRDNLSGVEWNRYDVLILATGNPGSSFSGEGLDRLTDWVRSGGRIIALDAGNRFFAGKDGFALKTKASPDSAENENEIQPSFADRERASVSNSNAGSVYSVSIDNTHPLGFGMDETYFSLKLGTSAYAPLKNGWNVGVVGKDNHVGGFVGYKAKERIKDTLVFGVQNLGAGKVMYMVDNPLFRGFWHNGKLLIANAVFLSGM